MDVIYPKKVRWHQVNWNTAYMRALKQNHAVLEKHWYEVNMNKLLHAPSDEKLSFLKQVKRWFDCRVLHSNAYDPIKRRTEIEKQIRLSGRWMKFPSWMQFDKEVPPAVPLIQHARSCACAGAQEIQANRARKPDPKIPKSGKTEATTEFEKMPEFKRLLWFLGSSEHQTM
eukprot:g18704.t1